MSLFWWLFSGELAGWSLWSSITVIYKDWGSKSGCNKPLQAGLLRPQCRKKRINFVDCSSVNAYFTCAGWNRIPFFPSFFFFNGCSFSSTFSQENTRRWTQQFTTAWALESIQALQIPQITLKISRVRKCQCFKHSYKLPISQVFSINNSNLPQNWEAGKSLIMPKATNLKNKYIFPLKNSYQK